MTPATRKLVDHLEAYSYKSCEPGVRMSDLILAVRREDEPQTTPAMKRLLEECDRIEGIYSFGDLRRAVAAVRVEADAPQAAPPYPDFGEPCSMDAPHCVRDRNGNVLEGVQFLRWKKRAVACVNDLAGVRNTRAVAELVHDLQEDHEDVLYYSLHRGLWRDKFNAEPSNA